VRIARVLTRLNLGGPARQALASDPLLAERGFVVRVLAGRPEPGEGDLFETFRRRGIDVVRVRGLRRGLAPASDLLAARRLRRELAAFRPDVVHTHASKAGTLGRRAAGALTDAARVARVHTFHGHVLEGYFPAAVSRRLIAHERRLARATDRVVAVSHATGDDLVRLGVVGEEKLVVVPPGVELAALLALPRSAEPRAQAGPLRARLGASAEDVLVGVVGRLAAVKRPELAVDVFARLRERHPRLHLVFVGDGTERGALERRIRTLPEDGARRVHLLGAVLDVAAVYAELDLVLATSHSEGMPVALIEAGAAGLPVVATDVGGVGELVAHERTGLLGRTPEELARALALLLADPDERRAMGERARLRVAARHGAPALAERLAALYEAVCAERSAAAGGA
jgi:glycosyltransferase involved in cell wall biosynthesis